jgi:hypothetical protein
MTYFSRRGFGRSFGGGGGGVFVTDAHILRSGVCFELLARISILKKSVS